MPLFMLIEVIFAAGVTLAVSSLIIQMRDLQQVLPIIISLGHLHDAGDLALLLHPRPLPRPGGTEVHGHWIGGFTVNLQVVYGFFNPLGPVITSVRQTMLLGHNPSWWPAGRRRRSGSVCYLVVGYRIFKRWR